MKTVAGKKKKDCCGCALCTNICPKGALSMVKDEEGFYYPKVEDSLCVSCGLCMKVCSFIPNETDSFQSYYICQSKSDEVLRKSASGGAFTHLSDIILNQGGIVCGAKYNQDFIVEHSFATTQELRNDFRDSKYIQSDLSLIYKHLIEQLKNGKSVLFSGTPCQCAAIREFVKRKKVDCANLFLIDIVCHGVGSPLIWSNYLDYVKEKYTITSIDSIVTRNKTIGTGYNLTITGGNMTLCKRDKEDPFISLFSRNYIQRPSCFHCPFKSWHRCTDITIGDFQKVSKYYPRYCNGKGSSVLLVNTEKGKTLFDAIKEQINYESVSQQEASQINLYQSEQSSTRREEFFAYYSRHTFIQCLRHYTEVGPINHYRGVIKRVLVHFLRQNGILSIP